MQLPCIFLQIRKADRQLNHLYGKFLARKGMRMTQYGLLRAIAGLEEPSITEIGRVLGIDQTTVTRNVEKLEKMDLVASVHASADSRKKNMRQTQTGPPLAQAPQRGAHCCASGFAFGHGFLCAMLCAAQV